MNNTNGHEDEEKEYSKNSLNEVPELADNMDREVVSSTMNVFEQFVKGKTEQNKFTKLCFPEVIWFLRNKYVSWELIELGVKAYFGKKGNSYEKNITNELKIVEKSEDFDTIKKCVLFLNEEEVKIL